MAIPWSGFPTLKITSAQASLLCGDRGKSRLKGRLKNVISLSMLFLPQSFAFKSPSTLLAGRW